MNLNWDIWITPVYFVYGLAFFSMGLALWIESGRASELGFARSMRLLAGFGLLHGIHEWIVFAQQLLSIYGAPPLPTAIYWLRVALLVTSFLMLLAFGEHLRALDKQSQMRTGLILLAVVWYVVSCVGIQAALSLDEIEWIMLCQVLARYIIGIPASLLAGIVLFRQRQNIENQYMRRYASDFTIAALAMLIYGVVGQIFVREAPIFPANILNNALFISIFGFPVEVLRAGVAVVLAISVISALRVIEAEHELQFAAMENARREQERATNEELSQLNATLKEREAETRRLYLELKERESLRTEFIQRVTAAQESERKRIGRELHDGTGQMLTGLALGLRGLSTQVHTNPELVIRRLSDLENMAKTTIGELRLLIHDLRPPQLDDMGLIPALRSLVERYKEIDGPTFELRVDGTPYPLSAEVETMLFRIVQEGISNVTKHAAAEHATVRLTYDDGVSICVCDDGVGCDTKTVLEPTSSQTSWGLIGIQERTNLINADWSFTSAPNKGTQLKVHVPRTASEVSQHAD
jgi:signal transduction histidine kinase